MRDGGLDVRAFVHAIEEVAPGPRAPPGPEGDRVRGLPLPDLPGHVLEARVEAQDDLVGPAQVGRLEDGELDRRRVLDALLRADRLLQRELRLVVEARGDPEAPVLPPQDAALQRARLLAVLRGEGVGPESDLRGVDDLGREPLGPEQVPLFLPRVLPSERRDLVQVDLHLRLVLGGDLEVEPGEARLGEQVTRGVVLVRPLRDPDRLAGARVVHPAEPHLVDVLVGRLPRGLTVRLLDVEGVVEDEDVSALASGPGLDTRGQPAAAPVVLVALLDVLVGTPLESVAPLGVGLLLARASPAGLVPDRVHEGARVDGVTDGELLRVAREDPLGGRPARPMPRRPEDGGVPALGVPRRHADEQVTDLPEAHRLEVVGDRVVVPVVDEADCGEALLPCSRRVPAEAAREQDGVHALEAQRRRGAAWED